MNDVGYVHDRQELDALPFLRCTIIFGGEFYLFGFAPCLAEGARHV
jgi:hypothetical protein